MLGLDSLWFKCGMRIDHRRSVDEGSESRPIKGMDIGYPAHERCEVVLVRNVGESWGVGGTDEE